jgi:hypothetical protein
MSSPWCSVAFPLLSTPPGVCLEPKSLTFLVFPSMCSYIRSRSHNMGVTPAVLAVTHTSRARPTVRESCAGRRDCATSTAGFSLLFLCGGAWAEDPELLLQRIKTHMLEHLKQLPNYACHETIDRLVRSGDSLRFVDQLEVEVAFEGTGELFSRPGSSRFPYCRCHLGAERHCFQY